MSVKSKISLAVAGRTSGLRVDSVGEQKIGFIVGNLENLVYFLGSVEIYVCRQDRIDIVHILDVSFIVEMVRDCGDSCCGRDELFFRPA